MARTDYGAILSTVITGTSQSIRNKEGTTDLIAPVNWSREISRMNHSLTDTVKGSVCSFNDGADGTPIKSLKASVSGTGCNVVKTGANQWDEVWETGKLNTTTGADYSSDNGLRSVNYIPVKSNTTYYFVLDGEDTANIWCMFYDKNQTVITGYSTGREAYQNACRVDNYNFTTPTNCYFIRFYRNVNVGYNNNISINYPSTDTSYHAYTGTTYPISWATEVGTITSGTMTINADGTIDVTSGGTTTRLTSTVDIRTLLGTNNIWCDTGDISNLTYYMDMDLYIQSGLIEETVASAPVASFSDGMKAYPLKELSLSINPTQSGSGDPAPDNIRPITGVSSVNVTRCGKNWYSSEIELGNIDGQGRNSEDGSSTRARTKDFMRIVEGTYTVSADSNYTCGIFYYRKDKTMIGFNSWGSMPRSFTTPTDTYYVRFSYQISGGVKPTENQVEKGSQATTYIDDCNTYTIALGDTYYGATLDVVRGKLRVTNVVFLLSNITLSYAPNSGKPYVYALVNDYFGNGTYNSRTTDCFCSMLKSVARTEIMNNGTGFQIESNHGFYIADNDIDKSLSAQDFINAVQAKYGSAQFCCLLTTPIEIDLTPTQINTLLGSNNIWHDGNGNTSCTYYANGQLYVEQHSQDTRSLPSLSKSPVEEEVEEEKISDEGEGEETK